MKLAFSKEIKYIDKKTMEEGKMPSLLLMENAGRAVFEMATEMLTGNFSGKKVCIFAGKGNNGGDAFVAARYLLNNGAKVRIFLLTGQDAFEGDAASAFAILKGMKPEILELTDDKAWDRMLVYLLACDLIIDGLLGTGFKGRLEENFERVINIINNSGKTVLSIDIPSGVGADDGKVETVAVLAANTVTLALPKPGLFIAPGRSYTGKIAVAPIGIPSYIINEAPIQQKLITGEMVTWHLPRRQITAHKNQAKVAVIAGEKGKTGAAALCCEAALRTGAGIVQLFTAQDVADNMALKLTEVMVDALATDETGITSEFIDVLLEKTAFFPVLAIGPGLGNKTGTAETVCQLLQKTDKKLVLDADALNAVVGNTKIFAQTKEIAVLTPHLGEMARLTSLTVEQMQQEGILQIARRFAVEWQSILILKGAPTVVAFPDGEIFVNTAGNPGMATAGSGDVLTGVIAGLIAQGMDQAPAAVCGVYLHSLAADLIAREVMIGMTAGDIVSALPKAISELNK